MIRVVPALAMLACAPHVDPGPIPAQEAEKPVELLEQPGEGNTLYLHAQVRAGSAYDPPGKEGLAALTARSMVDAGAGERSGQQLKEALYPTGNTLSVLVDREWVTFRLACHVDHAELCIDAFADVLTKPRFDASEVEQVQQKAIYQVTQGILADEEALGGEVFLATLYEGHPYGHPITGRAGSLGVLDDASARGFYADQYHRRTVFAGLAGAFDDAHRGRLLERLEALPAALDQDTLLQGPASISERALVVVETETPVTGFHLGHPIEVDRNHPDWAALQLAMTWFGAHRQSFGHLFRTMRTARGLNYGDYAYTEWYVQRGWSSLPQTGTVHRWPTFYLWIRPTSTDNGPFALKLAIHELELLIENGMTEQDVSDTKAYLTGHTALLAQDPGQRLAYTMDAAVTDTPNYLTLPDPIASLDAATVNEALKKHLDPSKLQIVAVTGDPDGLISALIEDQPTPIVYADVTPSEEQAEKDKEVSESTIGLAPERVYRLNAQGVFQ